MERHSPEVFLKLNYSRGILETSMSPVMMWEQLFSNMDVSKPIEICITISKDIDQTIVIKKDGIPTLAAVSGALPKDYGIPIKNTYPLKLTYHDPINDIDSVFALTDNGKLTLSLQKPIINIPRTIYFNSRAFISNQQVVEAFGIIELAGKKFKCINVLQKLDSRIKDLSVAVIGGISGFLADIGLNSRLSINMLGDGINKLLHIVLNMLANPNSIILIDEIENGFHYSFYPKLWEIIGELAVDTGCQVLATTYSYECIEGAISLAANKDKPDLFRFIRLDRENDKIVPKVFANDSFEYSVNNGWEVR
jgi:hypothetical protein